MAYPDEVLVRLLEIDGNSCGTLEEPCDKVTEDTDIPVIYDRNDNDPFRICTVTSIHDTGGNVINWQVEIYRTSGSCFGRHYFRLENPGSNPQPMGNYCKYDPYTQSIDCNDGKAAVLQL